MLELLAVVMMQQAGSVYETPGVPGFTGDLPLKYERALSTQIALTIELSKESYELGDMIEISAIATNVSDDPVLCHCLLVRGSIDIEYRRHGEAFRLLALNHRYPEMLPLYRLEPGEAVREVNRISYDPGRGHPLLDSPGRYEFRITYFDSETRSPESRVVSSAATVEVLPASDPDAFAAYKGDLALLVHRSGGGVPHDALLNKAADFLNNFGKSIYAPAVRGALAAMLRWRVYDEHGRLRADATKQHQAMYEQYR